MTAKTYRCPKCDRVLAADGSLHGYCGRVDSAALAKKLRLLEAERLHR